MITCSFISPSGAAYGFHRLRRVEILYPEEVVMAYVEAWANETAFVAGASPGWAHTPIRIPLASAGAAEAWLVAEAASPFVGGSVVADPTNALDSVKSRSEARIKAARNAAIAGGFLLNTDTFACDLQSQVLILGACLRATRAQTAGAPLTTPAGQWTTADDRVLQITLGSMIAIGEAMGDHITKQHDVFRVLRKQIMDAADAAGARGVTWPPRLPGGDNGPPTTPPGAPNGVRLQRPAGSPGTA